ncbi:phosphotransferase family protein [Blastococcus sp. SYSU D00695]
MQHEPDGVEVVGSAQDATRLPAAPLLVLDRLTAFLDQQGVGSGPVAWERIGDGQSNVTYRICREGAEVVLRRGPRPPLPRSTHDMVRESRIQQLLRPAGVPVPEVLAVCADESVLGVPFYLMEALDGVVLTDELPAGLDGDGDRGAIADTLVDTLVQLHSIDVTAGELATLGRPDGYLARQVDRFAGLWDVNTTRSLPEVALLAGWLSDNRPAGQAVSVVHGDYRLGNLMYHRTGPARVQAVLDWEMATLGDPLADLGYLTATYAGPDAAPTPLELSPVTSLPGFPTEADLAARYAAATGLDLAPLPWYQALALWKGAIFCEAIHTRWLKGERPDDQHFGPSLAEGVPRLLERAREYAGLGRTS